MPLGTLAGEGSARAHRGPGGDDEEARSCAVDEQEWKLEADRKELLHERWVRRQRISLFDKD